MPDYSQRSQDQEVMDDLACSGEVVNQTLRELETINKLLGGNYVTLDGLGQLIADRKSASPLSLVDVGCGGGDMLRLIHRWSKKRKQDLVLSGVDVNPFIATYAQLHTPPEMNIRYDAVDIFSESFASRQYDLLTGTLFFHHFSAAQLVHFFRQAKRQIRVGMVINDIHRHWFAYHSIKWLTRMFSRSSMVKVDGPLSVLRAFTRRELEQILEEAGIKNYKIRWMWAFRWQVVIRL